MNDFRPPDQMIGQDWDRLARWLESRGKRWDVDVLPRQFSGGLANLNYLVSVDGRPAVLRRPPAGPTAEGANDMGREWRVLSGLAGHFPLTPQPIAYCDAADVLGAPFQLIETPATLTRAPQFAEHTDEILHEIGLSDEQLIELKIAGAVT